jgi:transposase
MIVIGADTQADAHARRVGRGDGPSSGRDHRLEQARGRAGRADLGCPRGDDQRVWAIEDVRHVSGRLERELIRHGQAVLRVPPRLMAGAGPAGRLRGRATQSTRRRSRLRRSARAWTRSPVARLEGVDLELRRLQDRREDLVAEAPRDQPVAHDMHRPIEVPARAMDRIGWTAKLKAWTARQSSVQGRIAHDTLLRIRALTRDINAYEREFDALARQHAGVLIDNVICCGSLTAAKIVGIDRFRSEAFTRSAGTAPVPASSGRTGRHRSNRGGNRQLNLAFRRTAIYQARVCPNARAFLRRKQAEGETRREVSCRIRGAAPARAVPALVRAAAGRWGRRRARLGFVCRSCRGMPTDAGAPSRCQTPNGAAPPADPDGVTASPECSSCL